MTYVSKHNFKSFLSTLIVIAASPASIAYAEDTSKNAAKFFGDFRLRYESVQQDNALQDADALTLRSRIGFKTANYDGFSALIEVEDVREIVDDYSVPPAGIRPGQFSVIADPEGTEIDQAFVQYSNEQLSLKLGRQVLTLDGHRFLGHVGWRQDRQTFDGAVLSYKPAKGLSINASYIDKRNRIFSEERDVDSKDIILNSSYKTPVGKFTAYAYLLEEDQANQNTIDTFGLSLVGSKSLVGNKLLYTLEYAKQEFNNSFDSDYLFFEGGVAFSGPANGLTIKLGLEKLGSDDGQRGFVTPLATLHKFNGWSDQFLATPNQGLEDIYLSISGKFLGGKWAAIYHDFSSEFAIDGASDLGDELNLVYSRKFGENFSGGVKLADYSAGSEQFAKVDTRKAWLWAGYKF